MRVNGNAQGVNGQVVIQVLEPIECESSSESDCESNCGHDEDIDQNDIDRLEVLVQSVL